MTVQYVASGLEDDDAVHPQVVEMRRGPVTSDVAMVDLPGPAVDGVLKSALAGGGRKLSGDEVSRSLADDHVNQGLPVCARIELTVMIRSA